eukprot:2393578-Ditylum_brightwellii.AAC.1
MSLNGMMDIYQGCIFTKIPYTSNTLVGTPTDHNIVLTKVDEAYNARSAESAAALQLHNKYCRKKDQQHGNFKIEISDNSTAGAAATYFIATISKES